MTRKSKIPINIPAGVEINIKDREVSVKGPKGTLSQNITHEVIVAKEDNVISCSLDPIHQEFNNFLGLYHTLISNMIEGVTKGFDKTLEMIGVGYRAAVKGPLLDLQVGFSHPTEMKIPEGLTIKVEKNTSIIISGCDKQSVGQFAALIRAKRPPEPFQGKGIRYKDESVRRKAGKAAAKK